MRTILNARLLSVLLLALPALANAHPGHSALDVTAGAPHVGHEPEVAMLFGAIACCAAVLGWRRWVKTRR